MYRGFANGAGTHTKTSEKNHWIYLHPNCKPRATGSLLTKKQCCVFARPEPGPTTRMITGLTGGKSANASAPEMDIDVKCVRRQKLFVNMMCITKFHSAPSRPK